MTDEGEDAIRVWKKNILKALHEAKEKNVTIIRKNMSEIFVKLTQQSERHDEKLTHIDYLRYFIFGPASCQAINQIKNKYRTNLLISSSRNSVQKSR